MEENQALTSTSQKVSNINAIIEIWLKSKFDESKSERTLEIYRHYITLFRIRLRLQGMDLDGLPFSCQEPTEEERKQALRALSIAAQGWASNSIASENSRDISASTYNQRLAILSSFYLFARKRQLLIMDNPIDLLDRRDIQEYNSAQPFPRERVEQVLRAIDRSVFAGKRDYALLLVFFSTGRRASEVLALQWKHVQEIKEEGTAIIHFERCKGNKGMYDTLEPRVWKALREYLQVVICRELSLIDKEQYLWLSFSFKNFKQPLTQRGLADVFMKHFGTMKIHTTRHTFAHQMEKTGASMTDIQGRLGHSNVATTGRYLQRLRSSVNEHASALLDSLGIEE